MARNGCEKSAGMRRDAMAQFSVMTAMAR